MAHYKLMAVNLFVDKRSTITELLVYHWQTLVQYSSWVLGMTFYKEVHMQQYNKISFKKKGGGIDVGTCKPC
jgi:hypothetical protein